MKPYDHKKIEQKWQTRWKKSGIYKTVEKPGKKKFYVLDMFPYISGDGLHVGHPKGYIATDIYSRFKRMQGNSVLHPMGFDAFGLPTENYAIKTKTNPVDSVAKNIKRFKKQLNLLGFDYDWAREINTTDPEYYRWTQWIFLQLFKHGLAYESNEPINWCPVDKTGLANEDVENGRCERCGAFVEKKPMRQWMLKITDYAEKLLEGLDGLDWEESIKELQRNWIGKSEGAEIEFKIKNNESRIKVFTTRADTLFGATYLVLAPEHPFVEKLKSSISNWDETSQYIEMSKKKAEIERTAEGKEKTGIELKGIKAVNPANKEEIPVWIADYVLPDYGTGAIMAVPAHDKRDWQFAKKFGLPIRRVIANKDIAREGGFYRDIIVHTESGNLENSGKFSGLDSESAKGEITKFVGGKTVTKYKLRDWVFSRQRYWGEPIPLIHCEKCGVVPVPEKDLPVTLPNVKHYEPTGTGESPLAAIAQWVNVRCPKCKGKAKRETNTMPQWAGSSWYWLRYMDSNNKKRFVDGKKEKYWSPVDFYVGGAEHATRHLIYARFWHRFLYDQKLVSTPEPFKKLQHVGLIMGVDGRKMSKRWGNVINPDDMILRFGADALRVYEMFMGPFDQSIAWNTENLVGAKRFLERVWKMQGKISKKPAIIEKETKALLHKTIKKVIEDISVFKFNTAISQLMIFVNHLEKKEEIPFASFKTFLLLLAPFAPHLTEELWALSGGKKSIHVHTMPTFNNVMLQDADVTVAIQINGKVRGNIALAPDTSETEALSRAFAINEIKKWVGGKKHKKVIYVPGKILSIVL